MVISSKDNETIKKLKKLKDKKYRDQENCYIIEGIKLIKEAINENAKIKLIIVCDDCKQENNIDEDAVNPQGILAVIEKEKSNNVINYDENLFLVLDDIQDPGNMGTILRTADSLNLKQIIVSKGSSDIYNPKVVRSTMGAIFRVNIIESDNLVKTLKDMKKHKIKIVTTNLQTDKKIYDVDYEKSAIVIGNEANGVSNEVLELADEKVKIPMPGKTESLNASVATAIILYEAMRKNLK